MTASPAVTVVVTTGDVYLGMRARRRKPPGGGAHGHRHRRRGRAEHARSRRPPGRGPRRAVPPRARQGTALRPGRGRGAGRGRLPGRPRSGLGRPTGSRPWLSSASTYGRTTATSDSTPASTPSWPGCRQHPAQVDDRLGVDVLCQVKKFDLRSDGDGNLAVAVLLDRANRPSSESTACCTPAGCIKICAQILEIGCYFLDGSVTCKTRT